MKQRNHRPRGQGEPQSITRAVTHIRLEAVNAGKLTALDGLAQVYMTPCQQYIDLFSTGRHYGTFHGKLRERQKRDREKRRRKAKLRKCLEKKGAKKLPSTSSKSGQRLGRHVRQEINRAVNLCLDEHPRAQIAYEQLAVASMNAYLYASNLAHIPRQLAWNAAKRGIQATRVKSAYSSQECSVCYYVDRANRPDQQTFCCVVCGFQAHADLNVARRLGDTALQACKDRQAVKALLVQRHQTWKTQNGYP